MQAFKKHRKYVSVFVLLLCSSFTMLAFQNCGPAIQSQNSSSVAGTSTTSSTPTPAPAPVPGTTPVPAPLPAPLPAPTPAPPTMNPTGTTTPLTMAERQKACEPFLDTTKPASLTVNVAELTMTSGLATGSGDSSTATFIQTITTGLKSNPVIPLPAGRTTAPATCNVNTTVSCVVATDPAHLAKIDKAVNMNTGSALYGVDEAIGADQGKMNAIAGNVANRNNNCSTALASTALTETRTVPQMPNVRNNGYRCVSGYYWIKMGVTTTIESSLITPTPTAVTDFKYVKITVSDKCWTETRLKAPADLPRLSRMGNQLAINDTWVAAVAPVDNNGAVVGTGAVYMFRNNGSQWNYHSKIVMSGASTNDTVSAAAISGNIMVISSQNRSAKQGLATVYLFDGTNWNYYQALVPPVSRTYPQLFGASLAFSGSHLVIGAPGYSNNATGNDLSGAAYVYSCNAATSTVCVYRATINNTRKAGAAFGSALAISGNRLAVGAPQAINITDQGDGYVEIFDIASTPTSVGYLAPPTANRIPAIDDAPTGMRFGASVDINGVTVAVGAPNYNDNTTDRIASGAAYLWTDFASTSRLLNSSPANGANNGQSVALNSAGLYVGCPNCTSDLAGAGLVRFYTLSGTLGYTLFALNKASNSAFGYAVKATNSYLAVGSPVKADPNNSGGASYVFKLP